VTAMSESSHPAEIAAEAVKVRQRIKNPNPPVPVPPVKKRVKATGASETAPSASRSGKKKAAAKPATED